MLTRLFKFSAPRPAAAGEIVLARLNARAQPMDRGEVFEDPLDGVLQAAGIGNVTGGGTNWGPTARSCSAISRSRCPKRAMRSSPRSARRLKGWARPRAPG